MPIFELQPYCHTNICSSVVFRSVVFVDHSFRFLFEVPKKKKKWSTNSHFEMELEMKWWKIKQQIFTGTSEARYIYYILYAVTWKSHSRIYNCVPVAALYYLNDMQSWDFRVKWKAFNWTSPLTFQFHFELVCSAFVFCFCFHVEFILHKLYKKTMNKKRSNINKKNKHDQRPYNTHSIT